MIESGTLIESRGVGVYGAASQRAARGMLALILAVIAVLSLVPGPYRPHTAFPGQAEHFAAYAVAGFVLTFAYVSARGRILGWSGLAAASGAFELLQRLSPGRHPSVCDAIASSSGAATGAALGVLLFALILPKSDDASAARLR